MEACDCQCGQMIVNLDAEEASQGADEGNPEALASERDSQQG